MPLLICPGRWRGVDGFSLTLGLGFRFILRKPQILVYLQGFDRTEILTNKERRMPLLICWCRWRGSNPHGIATTGF